jgi:hypothetical protein
VAIGDGDGRRVGLVLDGDTGAKVVERQPAGALDRSNSDLELFL